ncbi:MAG: xanthine dehydrogenase family protein subunit M [Desulfomonile tiedjei]|nr:xanthine dehydrogenase family protein subunit M [Desulfomonile tiedjei]
MRNVFLPRDPEELWAILQKEPDAAIYAGGTDVLVMMRSRRLNPPCLICLERLEALKGIREHGEEVFIGAATTHSRVAAHQLIRQHFPVLAKGASVLGSAPIRHMGTIGGNIVTASPAGDTLPALYVLEAEVEIGSANQTRRVPLNEFITGPGTVGLAQGEALTGVWLKKTSGWSVSHYEKVGRRKAQACAVASMAALLNVSEAGMVEDARLAWGSVGPTVVTSRAVETALIGEQLTSATLKSAARLVEEAVSPIDDVRASAEYRRVVAGALLSRLSLEGKSRL